MSNDVDLRQCPLCGAWFYPDGGPMIMCWRCKEDAPASVCTYVAQRGAIVDVRV